MSSALEQAPVKLSDEQPPVAPTAEATVADDPVKALDELLQPTVAAEKLDELISLEREIAKMHHVEPTSPAMAQRVLDAVPNGAGNDAAASGSEADAVLLEISPPSRGTTPASAAAASTVGRADSALSGNGDLSGDGATASSVESNSNALKHADLIAVLKGIDSTPADTAPMDTKEQADEDLVEGVTIEGEGQFQIMEIVDDDLEEASIDKEEVTKPTAHSGLKSFAQATAKLTDDEIRAMAMEQMAGLDARSERQRRRKQDIKPLQVEENTDLVSSLGADWSDDDTGADEPAPVAAASKKAGTAAERKPISQVKEVAGDSAKKPEPERKVAHKASSVVVLQGANKSAESSVESAKHDPPGKDNESTTQPPPQTTGFRRTRIIKRKIIWDPDAPETQFSYAQLVRTPAKNSDATSSAKAATAPSPGPALTAAAVVKKEPPPKKVRPITPKVPAAAQAKEKKPVTAALQTQSEITPASSAATSKLSKVAITKAATAGGAAPNTVQSTKLLSTAAPSVASPAKRRSQTPVANGGAGGKRKKGELDFLMADEGAANMLNSLESERSRLDAEQSDDKPHRPLMRSRAATISERTLKRETTPSATAKSTPSGSGAVASTSNSSTPTTKAKRAPKPKLSSTWDYVYKQKASEDSMIIRRRSNSSYSSNASQHRLSLDAPVTPKPSGSNKSPASSTPASSKSTPRGTPKTPASELDTSSEQLSAGKANKSSFEFAKPESKTQQKTNRRTPKATNALANDMKKSTRATRSPAANVDESKERAKEEQPGTSSAAITGDVVVKKSAKVAQIIFSTQRAKLDYTFSAQMMNKLVDILDKLSKDTDCNVVVMTTNAPHFCHGIDFTDLTTGTAEKRKQAAVQLATAVKNYLKTLATFPKPLIAGVNGSNVGLGVTQLPLFDIIIASDKGSYEAPYAKIGQVPEGYCIWNNITKIRGTFKTKLFWLCEKLHSTESALSGLVNKLTASNKVNEDAVLIAKKMAAMPQQSYRFMKKTTIHNHLDTIVAALDEEFDTIIEQWTSPECFENFKKYIEVGHF